MKKITLSSNSIPNEDLDQLANWIKTYPRLSSGPLVMEFEKKLAEKVGSKYSVYVNSGSSANLLMLYALKAMDKLRNDKIVVPGLAWATTLSPVMQLGMHPILCDVNSTDLSVDLAHLEHIFKTASPACLMLVPVLGLSPNYHALADLCERYDVILLEDACESLGSTWNSTHIGTFGLMGSYSFFYSHQLCCIEGGAVVTDDQEVYETLLMLREHGWARKCSKEKNEELKEKWGISDFNDMYTFYVPGFNFRNTEISAYLGLKQLDRFDEIMKKRHDNFVAYNAALKTTWLPSSHGDLVANLGYPIVSPNRNEIAKELMENGVECRPLISGSMGRQPMYVKEYGEKSLPNCDMLDDFGMYVPNHTEITNEDIALIAGIVNKHEEKFIRGHDPKPKTENNI